MKKGQRLNLAWLIERGTTVAFLVGLIFYGVVRIGMDAFYSRLGVTPEEVGLSYAVILNEAALGFVTALVFSSALATMVALLVSFPIFQDLQRLRINREIAIREGNSWEELHLLRSRLEAGRAPSPVAFGYLMGTLVVVANGVLNARPHGLLVSMVLPVVGFVLVAIIVKYFKRFALSPVDEAAIPLPGAIQNMFLIFVAASLIGCVLLSSYLVGSGAADRARNGLEVSSIGILGWSLAGGINVRAECVTLVQLKTGMPPAEAVAPSRLLYLGEANNTLVLFGPHSGPIRLPASEFVVRHCTS
jgi:hypothetical protein